MDKYSVKNNLGAVLGFLICSAICMAILFPEQLFEGSVLLSSPEYQVIPEFNGTLYSITALFANAIYTVPMVVGYVVVLCLSNIQQAGGLPQLDKQLGNHCTHVVAMCTAMFVYTHIFAQAAIAGSGAMFWVSMMALGVMGTMLLAMAHDGASCILQRYFATVMMGIALSTAHYQLHSTHTSLSLRLIAAAIVLNIYIDCVAHKLRKRDLFKELSRKDSRNNRHWFFASAAVSWGVCVIVQIQSIVNMVMPFHVQEGEKHTLKLVQPILDSSMNVGTENLKMAMITVGQNTIGYVDLRYYSWVNITEATINHAPMYMLGCILCATFVLAALGIWICNTKD